jgi:predicted MFS family arabinose efflux permease
MLLAPRLLAESRQVQPGRRMDVAGAALVTAVAALVLAVSQAAIAGWTFPVVAAALALTAAAAAVFWVVERRHQDPLVRVDLLRLPSLWRAGSVNVLLGLWNGGEMLVLSIYFQQVLHDSPLVTGLAIAPQGVVGFAAGMFGARIAVRVGIRRVLIFASGLAMAGFLVLTQLPASGSYSLLLLAVMPVGFGTASTAFATMVIASGGVADNDLGLIGGVINTSRQLGAAIGAALLPAVAVTVNHTGSIAGVARDRAAMVTASVAGHAIVEADAYHSRRWGRWEHRQHAASAARRPRAVAAATRRGAVDRRAR